jgi:uncharacterized protein (TIGR03437 family)
VLAYGLPTPFTVSFSTESGGQWLSASPLQGIACTSGSLPFVIVNCAPPALVTVTVDPSHFTPGTYSGALTIMPQGLNPQPTVIPVVFNVYAQPTIFVDRTSLDLQALPSFEDRLHITSSADPVAFTAIVTTRSGQNWLSVTPSQGQTPATLVITANPVALNAQSDTGSITLKGPNNSIIVPVSLSPFTPPPVVLVTSPAALQFSTQPGQSSPAPQLINVSPVFDPFTVSSQTMNGGNWLSAVVRNGPGVPACVVSVDPTGLASGTYQGSITVTSAMASAPAQVPVTLTVWSGAPPPVTASPTSLSFAAVHGMPSISQNVSVSTGSLPLSFSVSTSTTDGASWLSAIPAIPGQIPGLLAQTPGAVTTSANASSLAPGTYTGTVTITAPIGSSNYTAIPVTFIVTPAPPPLPQTGVVPIATGVLNAASQGLGSLSPGEILTIFGQNIGPATPAGFALGPDGKVATSLGGAQVLFDGIAAPLLYASATQVNAIVPYEVNGAAATNIAVQYNGTSIPAGGYPVAGSAPGIFTLASSGQGAAAVLNQDNSVNSASNPAARGSSIQIYATGEGVTSPPGITGEVTRTDKKKPVLPVDVTIGGVDALITYAASAPDAVSGLFQVNVVVPQSVSPGSSVPIVVMLGKVPSQMNVTIAVK